MSDLFLLSQAQMRRIAPYFPLSHGIPRVDDRRVISGIIFVIKNGLRWRDAPKDYGPHALLLERKADLVDAVHPFQDDPRFQDQSRTLFRPADTLGKFELSFLTARTGFIAAHRAVLVDFLEDYIRAFHWYLDPAHRAEAIQIVAAATKRPPATFESWLFTTKDEYHDPDAMPDLAAVTSNIAAQHRVGLTKADLNAQDYADLGPLKEAIARAK